MRAACTASALSAYRRRTLRRRRGVPRRPRAIRVRRRISEGQEVSLVRGGRISERGWSATARAFSVRVGSRHDAARRRGRDQRLGSTCLTRRALFRPLGIGSPPSGGGRCLPPRPRSGPLAAMGCRLEVFARESPERSAAGFLVWRTTRGPWTSEPSRARCLRPTPRGGTFSEGTWADLRFCRGPGRRREAASPFFRSWTSGARHQA